MPIKPNHRLFLLFILVAVLLGIFKSATLRCISNDAVTFLEFTDQLHTTPGEEKAKMPKSFVSSC